MAGQYGADNFLVQTISQKDNGMAGTVAAKFLKDTKGQYVIDPLTKMPYIVPDNYDAAAVIAQFSNAAAAIKLETSLLPGYPNALAQRAALYAYFVYQFMQGGPSDLQRSASDGIVVPAFINAASYSLGLAASATGLSVVEPEVGGGIFNQLFGGKNTGGLFGNTLIRSNIPSKNIDNAASINTGYNAGQAGIFGTPSASVSSPGFTLSANGANMAFFDGSVSTLATDTGGSSIDTLTSVNGSTSITDFTSYGSVSSGSSRTNNGDGTYTISNADANGSATSTTYNASTNYVEGITTVDGSDGYTVTDCAAMGLIYHKQMYLPDGSYRMERYSGNGLLTELMINRPDGSSIDTEYEPNTGTIFREKIVNADGSSSFTQMQYNTGRLEIQWNINADGSYTYMDQYDTQTKASGIVGGGPADIIVYFADGRSTNSTSYVSGNCRLFFGLQEDSHIYHPASDFSLAPRPGITTIAADGTSTYTTFYISESIASELKWTTNGYISSQSKVFPDGSTSSTSYYADGVAKKSTYSNADGSSGTMNYYGNGNLSSNQTTYSNGSSSLANYDTVGRIQSDSWKNADGTSGSDAFNTDGSSSGTTYAADGSYENYTDNGVGGITSTSRSANNIKSSDSWIAADGTAGANVFNTDGSCASTIYSANGSIASQGVTFAQGVKPADLHLTWGQTIGVISGLSTDPQLNYTTLNLSWGADNQSIQVMIPHSNDPLGSGVSKFTFADGSVVGMAEMIGMAPFAPNFDTGMYEFLLGMGIQVVDNNENSIQFGAGITAGNTQFFLKGADLLIKYGTQGDSVLIKEFAPNGVIDNQAIVRFHFVDGSEGSYTTDGQGSAGMIAYDANGNRSGDFWQFQDSGNHYGNNTYNADGSASGSNYNPDGSYFTYTENGHGVYNRLDYGSNGSLTGSLTKSSDSLGNNTVTNYDANGIKLSDTWTKADGSSGNDTFNADGSYNISTNDGHGNSDSTNYAADGTETSSNSNWRKADGSNGTYYTDGYGFSQSTSYDANGKETGQSWANSDGSHSTVTFNAAGTCTTTYNADGSYNISTDDGQGNSNSTNYAADGTETSSNWRKADGSNGTYYTDGHGYSISASYDANGKETGQSWTNSDGSSGDQTWNADGTSVQTQRNSPGSNGFITTTTYNYDATGTQIGGYSTTTTNSKGDALTINYDANGNQQSESWTKADGTRGSGDGSYSNTVSDGHGNTTTTQYNLLGKTGDIWTKADGSSGSDTYNADGSSSATWKNSDGTHGTSTDDVYGTTTAISYDANNNMTEQDWTQPGDQFGKTSYTYDASGFNTGDTWTQSDGSHGFDSYHADGSGNGAAYGSDGSYYTYTNDGHGAYNELDYAADGSLTGTYVEIDDVLGNWVGTNYDAKGIKLSDNWAKADGTSGSDTFNADGSCSGTTNNADGSHSSYTNDGHGNITTTNYDANGNVLDAGGPTNTGSGNVVIKDNGKGTVTTTSADGLTIGYVRDTNGDGIVEQRETVVKDATGAKTDDLKNFNANGTLKSETVSVTIPGIASANCAVQGGLGNDTLTSGAGNDFIAGGKGNDVIQAGAGNNVIAVNAHEGQDTILATAGANNTLSLGGGIKLDGLTFSKTGNNLILGTGNGDAITLKNWYAATANHSIVTLQVIAGAMADYNASSTDPLRNKKVETFDFAALASQFDTALAANSTLTSWSLMDSLLSTHLAGSDTAALGGDLAYLYGMNGGLTGVGLVAAQDVLAASQLEVDPENWTA